MTAVALLLLLHLAADPAPIRPPALAPGDTVTIIAPAGNLDRERIERAARRIEAAGLRVKLPPNLYRRRGYLAGTDAERAEELMAAFRDPDIRGIFCGAGGYGTTRILNALDYDAIRDNPRVFTGFSDITGLHLAIRRHTGLITFHSPVAAYGLGSADAGPPFTIDAFWRAVLLSSYLDPDGKPLPPGYTWDIPKDNPPVRTISPGVARGRLTGGNLTLICTLMGTPHEIDTAGHILFIEDRNEEPYRIDRYLSQLRLAGKLDRLAGVILGVFTECAAKTPGGLTLEQIFDDYFADSGVPVIWNWPVGHYRYNATLPLGAMAELDANAGTLRLLENPVSLPWEVEDAMTDLTEKSE